MERSEYVAALDLGTSKMIAMAARKNEQGILSIIDAEKINSTNCIRRGCIYNINETKDNIEHLIRQLNHKLETPIEKVYVGIGGQSLRTKDYALKKEIDTVITQGTIDSLLEQARGYEPPVGTVLDVVSVEYYVDGKQESVPRGISGRTIELKCQLIIGNPSLKNNLQQSVEKAGTQIAGFFISPLATAAAVLNDTEKELGCALVEFGAGITYVSVYRGGLLRHLVALPLGGNVIDKDICDLNVLEKNAEGLKINFGSALVDDDCEEKINAGRIDDDANSKNEIKLQTLNAVIEARIDEIIANIIEQINQSGYSSTLGAGIVITGGGAALKDLKTSLQSKSGKDVRVSSARKTLVNQAAEITSRLDNSTVIGLLALGKENCARKEVVPVHKPGEDMFGNKLDEKKPKVEPPRGDRPPRGERIPPEKKEKEKKEGGSIFGTWKKNIGKKIDGLSGSLFDDEENNKENNEE